MKIYLKILSITAGLQLAGFILMYVVDYFVKPMKESTIFPIYIGVVFMIISVILGVLLPIKWYEKKWKKICGIMLLPTNYTWIVIAISLVKVVENLLNILFNLPDNFG